ADPAADAAGLGRPPAALLHGPVALGRAVAPRGVLHRVVAPVGPEPRTDDGVLERAGGIDGDPGGDALVPAPPGQFLAVPGDAHRLGMDRCRCRAGPAARRTGAGSPWPV